ncbi:MAG TPA: hypothetical protein VFX98_09100 [Longimicrobiaceae bacterium]|nr:hypothetical protein [Longimicrobiaceae bacterium]
MTSLVETVAALAQPWADLYRASDLLQFGLHATHLTGIAVAGGTALGADRLALRLGKRPAAQRLAFLAALAAKHRRVLTALAFVVASGVLLLLAQVRSHLPSPFFWIKMTTLGLLLWNGSRLRRAERRLLAAPEHTREEWGEMETHAARSAGLWVAMALLGVILTTLR